MTSLRPLPGRMAWIIGFAALVTAVPALTSAQQPLVAGRNVNMAGGPAVLMQSPFTLEGDPNLERQNEISIDCSGRNPLHCLASANDYRLVDINNIPDLETSGESAGDAWLGFYTTTDGGARWRSFLHRGHPRDPDTSHPLKPYHAAADATVRCGSNGMCWMSGIAFIRGENQPSAVFLTSVIDDNNREAGNPWSTLGTTIVDKSNSKFLDKTWLEVDRPRAGANTITIPAHDGIPAQSFAVGNVYIAYAVFVGNDNNVRTKLMFGRSLDGGKTIERLIKVSEGYPINQGVTMAIDDATGAIYLVWRQFASQNAPHAILVAKSTDFGQTFTKAMPIASRISPFEQGTTIVSFRSSAFPTAKVVNGKLYVAWSNRTPPNDEGRIVVAACTADLSCAAPVAIDNHGGRGHQLMPSLASSGNQVVAAYLDLRNDHTIGLFDPNVLPGGDGIVGTDDDVVTYDETRHHAPKSDLNPEAPEVPDPARVYTRYVMDAVPDPNTGLPVVLPTLKRRHTLEVRAIRLNLSNLAASGPSIAVSSYPITNRDLSFPGDARLEQLKFFAPGFPLFVTGLVPFVGDYIDAVGVPAFVPQPDGTWVRRNSPGEANVYHVGWGDNRDVRPPADGNWRNFTPVTIDGVTTSAFDPSQLRPGCLPGQTGIRNQNPYTAVVTDGLLVGSLGNSKRLGVIDNPFEEDPNLTIPIQRAFTVFANNATNQKKAFRFSLQSVGAGVTASFVQLGPPVTAVDVEANPYSSVTRTVFVTAPSNPTASVTVLVQEIGGLGGAPVSGGLQGRVILNPDLSNPDLSNPDLSNPDLSNAPISGINASEVYNPDLSNPDLSNPDLSNPDLSNPDLSNPDLSNVSVANPDLSNPDLSNPDLSNPDLSNPDLSNVGVDNPDLSNPDLSNPDLSNAGMQDTSWTLSNHGNTTAGYRVKLLSTQTVPPGFKTQLIITKTHTAPTATDCTLRDEVYHTLLANIPNPEFINPGDPELLNPDLTDGAVTNATVSIPPGDTAKITLRVYDPNKFDAVVFDASQVVAPAAIAQAINTEALIDPDIPDVPSADTPLWVAIGTLNDAILGQEYSQPVGVMGGTPPYTWSIVQGSLPTGLTLNALGLITGAVDDDPGIYPFRVQIQDSSEPPVVAVRDLTIEVVEPLVITTTTLPAVTSGQNFAFGLETTGGKGTKSWSLTAGALPAGVTLSPAGVLGGASNAVGAFPFTVQVTDQTLPTQTDTQDLILQLAPVMAFIAQPSLVSVDEAIVPGVRVEARDGAGAGVPNITLALAVVGAGTTMYGSTSAVTDAAGVATFPNVRFDTSSTIQLRAEAFGGASPNSDLFSILGMSETVFDGAGDSDLSDIVYVDAFRNGDNVTFSVTFSPGTFDPAVTLVALHLDTDQDNATGQPAVNGDCTLDAQAVGSEYLLAFGSTEFTPGHLYRFNYPPCNARTLVASNLTIVQLPNGYQVSVPRALIGGDDGRLNYKATTSNHLGGGSFTGFLDIAPNVGTVPGHLDNPYVDQAQPVTRSTGNGYSIFTGVDTFQELAQVITPGWSGQLREVRVPVSACSGLIVEIRSLVDGLPDGAVLASQTVPGSAFPNTVITSEFTRIVFDTPATVVGGQAVGVVLRSDGQCNMIDGPIMNGYPGGNGYFRHELTPTWTVPGGGVFDLPFLIVMSPPPIQ